MRERFTALQNYGEDELKGLDDSTAAVVGLGATGSVIAEHLARHGVNLVLVDRDFLEENDLYSSNVYTREDVEEARPKARALADKLDDFTKVEFAVGNLQEDSLGILDGADIVMDGTDNLATRRLINAYCKREDKTWVFTSAVAEQGYSMLVQEECLECGLGDIDASSPETCETSGIMREVSSVVAARSSMKAIQHLAGKQPEEKLEIFSGPELEVKSPGCEVCEEGQIPGIEKKEIYSVCGENKFQVEVEEPDLEKISEVLENFSKNEELVRGSKDDSKVAVFASGRAIIEARTRDEARQKLSELGV